MLSWNDYDVKCEQYADMRRAADNHRELQALRAQRQRRVIGWAWFGRKLGRSMMAWGARLEARYSS